MPSTSKKQHNLMAMVANDSKAAKRLGIPQSVGEEYMKADKGRKFSRGGDMAESKKMVEKEVSFMKKKGAPKAMIKHEEEEVKGMKAGGRTKAMPNEKDMGSLGMKKGGIKKYAKGGGIESKGKTKGTIVKMAGGGCAMRKAGRGR